MKDATVLAIEAIEGVYSSSTSRRCILLEELDPKSMYLVLSGFSNAIGTEVTGYTGRVLRASWRSLAYSKFSNTAAKIPDGYSLVELPSKNPHCLAARPLWKYRP